MTAPEPLPSPPVHRQLGLTDDELAAIVELLGRDPTELELAMYAVMWSEHCSYKSSKRLPRPVPHRGALGARRARARAPA